MDLNLSEICTMLGDRIEQYNNSAAKKRKLEKTTALLKTKYAKHKITNTASLSKNAELTPKAIIKQYPPVRLYSATKMPTGESLERRVMRVHRKIISQPRKFIFYDSDDFEE